MAQYEKLVDFQVVENGQILINLFGNIILLPFLSKLEAIWLSMLLDAIGHQPKTLTTILCNNNAAINLLEDPLLHNCVKHINIKHHFLCECVQSNKITLSYINTYNNIADIFTKALDARKSTRFCEFLGIK